LTADVVFPVPPLLFMMARIMAPSLFHHIMIY